MNVSPFDPVKCETCGNDDQDTMLTEPSHVVSAHGEPKARLVYLMGYRCGKCGHVTKLETVNK